MNTFRQHIPGSVDVDRLAPQSFATTADLLALEAVQRFKTIQGFSHFALGGNRLMAIMDAGQSWWVVGYIEDSSQVELPTWERPK